MNIKLAVSDGVVVIAMVTCRAEDAVCAESEAVIGRRVAIVRTGVRQCLQAVARAKSHGRLGNDRHHVRRRVDDGTIARTQFHFRRDYL